MSNAEVGNAFFWSGGHRGTALELPNKKRGSSSGQQGKKKKRKMNVRARVINAANIDFSIITCCVFVVVGFWIVMNVKSKEDSSTICNLGKLLGYSPL